jgi:hypothetical protein
MWRIILPSVFNYDSSPLRLSYRVIEVDAPYQRLDVQKSALGSGFSKIAKHHNIGELSLKIDEYEDGLSLKYFDDWRNMIRDDTTGLYNSPFMYKKTIDIIKVASTNFDLHYTRYVGVFPTDIASTNFSYESSGILTYNVTFSVEDVKQFFVPSGFVTAISATKQGQIAGDSSLWLSLFGLGGVIGEIDTQVKDFMKGLGTLGKTITDRVFDKNEVGTPTSPNGAGGFGTGWGNNPIIMN